MKNMKHKHSAKLYNFIAYSKLKHFFIVSNQNIGKSILNKRKNFSLVWIVNCMLKDENSRKIISVESFQLFKNLKLRAGYNFASCFLLL